MHVNIAVVGTGGIAQRHGEALSNHENVQLIGAIDVDDSKAAQYAKKFGGRAYSTLTECLEVVDAVYILTPPSVRKQYALQAIEAGKHIFCEKPPRWIGIQSDWQLPLRTATLSPKRLREAA
jgi:UDP-N-acetylglucosamine 3-dehydrogenase